jgi:PhnB protein
MYHREPLNILSNRKESTMAKVKPIPDGYHTLTPYLIVKGGVQALDFYKKAFGAVERFRFPGPGGTIGHAEIQIGNSMLMLGDESPQALAQSPQSLKGTTFGLAVYVEDVDAAFKRAVDAGAKVLRPVQDQFYGDRSGTVADPFGHQWTLSTHKEDVSPEEMQKRLAELAKKSDKAH